MINFSHFQAILLQCMWKGKSAHQRTVNLCNEFLVIQLNKKKNQLEKIGMDRKAMVYHTAIASIRKYPLPIICLEQLKSLYGIGDLVSQQLLKVIKAHYKSFIRDLPQPMATSDVIQNNNQLQEEQSIKVVSCSKSIDYSEFRKGRMKQQTQKQSEAGDDSQRAYSCKSLNTNRPYKPRPNTQSAYVILILCKYRNEEFISRDRVLEQLKNLYNVKMTPKSYIILLSNLQKSGYLVRYNQDDSFIKLTPKGIVQGQNLEIKTKEKQSCLKVRQRLVEFKQNQIVRPPKSVTSDRPKDNLVYHKVAGEMVLLIDSRQIKEKQDQSFFEKRMKEKYNIKCRTSNLPIGDFMWEYQEQIIDCVIQRKKADDLISSIHDGRYKEQKFRLKSSSFNNIYYLLQGHLSSGFAKFERQIEGAVLNTRLKDGFKVVTVNNISESTKFVNFITEQLKKKLLQEKSLISLGTLQDVVNSNGKASQLTIENIFGLSLKTIPGIGKVAVNEVLKHFKCFRELHDALSKLQSRFQKIQFLRQLLRGCGVRLTLPELLVDVIFGEQKKLI